MLIADKYKIELGNLKQGEQAVMNVTLTNVGQSPVQISLWAGCGCTAPISDKYIIAPNEHAHLSVTFDTMGKSGFNLKYFGVKYKDDKNGDQVITIEFTANISL